MEQPVTLFADPRNKSRIQSVASGLRDAARETEEQNGSLIRLSTALELIASNAEEFDKHCQFNVGRIGTSLSSTLFEFKGNLKEFDLQRLNSMIFRFVSEFDLSIPGELGMEMENFIRGVIADSVNYTDQWKEQIDYARHRMPISILKSLLNSSDFTVLRQVQSISQQTSDVITAWKTEIAASEGRAKVLQETLTEQKNAFNFVGLSKGFSDLEEIITKELDRLQGILFILGLLLLLPVTLEFLSVVFGWIDTKTSIPITLIISAAATLTATLLFLYFFRITLRSADSCRAQLVQIRLRMTLCQFIQNYAEYSTEIKEKNSEALSKFENLIFSGIVSNDEKLPSTFDGIEQLGGLFKAVRGEAK
jgi:hypothetical protein